MTVSSTARSIPKMLPHVKTAAAAVHAAVPDLVLEGAVFEIVTVRCFQRWLPFPADPCSVPPHLLIGTHPLLMSCRCSQKPGVESLAVPAYVFEAFGLPATSRNFNYSAMLFPDGASPGTQTQHASLGVLHELVC